MQTTTTYKNNLRSLNGAIHSLPTYSTPYPRKTGQARVPSKTAFPADPLLDLKQLGIDLYRSLLGHGTPGSALQFVSVFRQLSNLNIAQRNSVIHRIGESQVLIENEHMKAVLIHWAPGSRSRIHGHPDGGCVFKVLYGKLEEQRYTSKEPSSLVSENTLHAGGMGYIHDQIGYHAVGNPFRESAISLHAYATGA